MAKRHFKSFLITLVFLLTFSSLGTGAGAAGKKDSQTASPLAKLVGEFNLTSSNRTSIIVELTEPSLVEAKHKGKSQSKANLSNIRNQVKSEVMKAAKSSNVGREYDYVFSGFAVELAENEIPSLLAVPGVKAVYPDVEYQTTSLGEGEVISQEEYSPNMLNSAPYIGAKEAWETGYTGKGVKVAVIDTGVDYTHPDLKNAFGSYKGWDFVDNDNDPQETPIGDPRGDATTHGSHVAGTVAANGLIKGVAPDATLLGYRVLGPGGRGTSENVIAGIEKAVQDGADVMNLSLGNSINDPDYATSIALDWAMAEGVVAVTSNGNSGPKNWTVGSPGTARDAISVGATQLPYNVYNAAIATSGGVSYPSSKVMGFASDADILALNGKELEFVNVGLGTPGEFAGKDLTGKIALMKRGDIAFVDKAINAKNAGAVGAIIFNHSAGEQPDVAGMAVPSIKVSLEDGEKLLKELENGNNKVSFQIDFAHRVGEIVADFSSRGPVIYTWMVKPDVSAPGVNIISTVPTGDPANPHGYGAKQGTSMASPHVAGAAALILQANPHWGVEEVKAALMNTAENISDPSTGKAYPHNAQGAGSIRVVDAIKAKTLVTPGSHSFGTFYKDNGKQVEKQKFTIKNLSSECQTYSFEVNMGEHSDAIKVMTSNNLKVNPGQSQDVNFNVQVDAGKLSPGYYEGTITVSNGTETLDVPTILFVKEPDYPRVEYLGVNQLGDGQFEIEGFFPGGAEEVELFVYLSNKDAQPIGYLGDITVYRDVKAGYTTFKWDGKLADGTKLPAGYYYNIYAYATYLGQKDLAGANILIK
ncbi:S8 family serine peptidase [Cytobacillus dafuensis]|uniref:S8 family serine peptidase n=1 Tax=Cytobacillus dafuensis TaxID=1742359 RepID=A0A5B8Z164_CYTDA|nr:S8 family serine peptidase [Cytobacillus dafuensis]QED46695.1 S8 family serine peptidase [Cytobacillus dafuensis]